MSYHVVFVVPFAKPFYHVFMRYRLDFPNFDFVLNRGLYLLPSYLPCNFE